MRDLFYYIFEGEIWSILLKIGICILTLFLIHQCWFYTLGKETGQDDVPVSLKKSFIEWKNCVDSFRYNSWFIGIFRFSVRNKTYLDMLTIVFIPSLIVFYFFEWFINFCLLFINFDESGLLNFVIKWMPDNWFFNIVRACFNVIDGFETTVMLYFCFCVTFVFFDTYRRGLLIPLFFKIIFVLVVFILYDTDCRNWVIGYFDLGTLHRGAL